MIFGPLWKLRTDPFYPATAEDGSEIERAALETCLNPARDRKVLPLYFDSYNWDHSLLVRDLSADNAFDTFPTRATLVNDSRLMIIISGSRQTGRDSLANLLLHKIGEETGKRLLLCELPLEGRDKSRNTAAVATAIMDAVEFDHKPFENWEVLRKRMRDKYEEVRSDQKDYKDPSYTNIFSAFEKLLTPHGRELVIKITKGGDHDSWARIHEFVGSCCYYIIVLTEEDAYAKTCYDAMLQNNMNVCWIRAVPLKEEAARKYVASRLKHARITGANAASAQDLFPFTADAIRALYEPGPTLTRNTAVEHPVGWLRRTLNEAVKEHVQKIGKLYPGADPATLAAIAAAEVHIGPEGVRRARQKLNQVR